MYDLIKIKKDVARRAFNNGFDIMLLPSKIEASEGRAFFHLQWIAKGIQPFDESVNDFQEYECYSEIGLTARFYMDKSDFKKYELENMK